MKFGFLAAAAALALGTQSASAQQIIVQSGGYSPGYSVGGTIVRPGGLALGGYYSTGPAYYAPQLYSGPVLIPVRPVVSVVPVYGVPVYGRSYYGTPHHHHRGRW